MVVRQEVDRVLVTYGWVRSSYSALRNLASNCYSVHVADTGRVGMSQFSRFKKSTDVYRSHYDDEMGFLKDLKAICHDRKIQLVFPSHNETEIIAKYRSEIGEDLCRIVPKYDHCLLFNDKFRTYDFVESIGVPVPRRFGYSNPSELLTLLIGKGPVVIKLRTGNSSKGVFYADTPEQATAIVNRLIKKYSLSIDRYPQVEEKVEGEGWGVSVLYWEGELVADFCHVRLREKVSTGGTSTLREVSDNRSLREAAHLIFSGLGWHGLAMCEFKVCPETGRFWFIEVNPRLWGSLPLAISSGVEFPRLACLCASHGPDFARKVFASAHLKTRHRSRWVLGDVLVALQLFFRFKVFAAVDVLLSKSDSQDDFPRDDFLVFIGEVAFYLSNTISSFSLNPEKKGMVR